MTLIMVKSVYAWQSQASFNKNDMYGESNVFSGEMTTIVVKIVYSMVK